MIVRMSKIALIGPKDLLMGVLSHVHELGVLQLESDIKSVANEDLEPYLKAHFLDEQALSERLFYDDLKRKIDALLEYIPDIPTRVPYLSPQSAVQSIAEIVATHTADCREL